MKKFAKATGEVFFKGIFFIALCGFYLAKIIGFFLPEETDAPDYEEEGEI